MIRPWPSKHRKQVGDFRIFTVDNDSRTSPRTGRDHDFYIINTRIWVNIIAVTPQEELVMVEQFRHGSNTVELEIPGGVIDHADESPLLTAERELREETGYAGNAPHQLADIFPNPAIMNNRAFTVLIENCTLKHPTQFDEGEDLITRLIPVRDIPKLVRDGVIRHGIVLVGLYYYDLHRRD